MVQSVLFFVLGFLCSGFIAVLVAPAVWRRAVALTRRRIEASVPLTPAEIQADKDRIRAEFAMTVRRLEINAKTFQEKAAAHVVEIGRTKEEIRTLAAERADKIQSLQDMETSAGELRAELQQREERLRDLTNKLAEAEQQLEQRAADLEKMGRMYDEASFASSNRQIELVAREAEIEKLTDDISGLQERGKDAERQRRELVAQNKAAQDAAKAEKKRAADVEKKLERMMSTLADREDKLERREKEIERLRDKLKTSNAAEQELGAQLMEAQSVRSKLETEHAALSEHLSKASDARQQEIDNAIAKVNAARERLETKLVALAGENERLRRELSAAEAVSSRAPEDDGERQAALLREQMGELAAEVVRLTAALEGPDSPILRALAAQPNGGRGPERATSLADRVRALQKAAAAG